MPGAGKERSTQWIDKQGLGMLALGALGALKLPL